MARFPKPTAAELARAKQSAAVYGTTPRVIAASYDEIRDRLNLEFDRGFAVAFSPRAFPGFLHATPRDLREIEILGSGDAVYFGHIDESLSVANLIAELTTSFALSAPQLAPSTSWPPLKVQGGYFPRAGETPQVPTGGSSVKSPKT